MYSCYLVVVLALGFSGLGHVAADDAVKFAGDRFVDDLSSISPIDAKKVLAKHTGDTAASCSFVLSSRISNTHSPRWPLHYKTWLHSRSFTCVVQTAVQTNKRAHAYGMHAC